MKTILGLAGFALVLWFWPSRAPAQSYSIDWFTFDAGGGASAGGGYSLDSSIGQSEVGAILAGGSFSLRGGFWSIVGVQATGTPLLKIFLTGTNTAVISWPSASGGFALQQNNQLDTSHWVPVGPSINDNGTNKFIIVNPSAGTRYYRLYKP